MALVCTKITEWIRENVSKPVEEWVEQREEKCKKRKWYDPRKWLCWIVTTLVKIIRWIVVTVVTVVVKIVCHLIADLLSIIWNALKFIFLLLAALFTWSKCRLKDAIESLINALVGALTIIGDAIIRPIVDMVQTYRLRRFVKREIAQTFWMQPDVIPKLNEKFSVDHGVFGFRCTCTIHTMAVNSQTVTGRFGDVPDLFALHDAGLIDLFELAGFKRNCAFFDKIGWYHPRHQTAKFPFASGGGGFGDPVPPELEEEELQEYIDSAGTKGPHFLIYAVSSSDLDKKTNSAEEKARQLGIIFKFERKIIEVTAEDYINWNETGSSFGVQTKFLSLELGRHHNRPPSGDSTDPLNVLDPFFNPVLAEQELCSPVAVAVYWFDDREGRGMANNLRGTTACADHNLDASINSGVSFIDDTPDSIRRYVLVHELGHYFGLCHVDGFERIMVSGDPKQGDVFTWKTIPNSLLHGGPRFTFAEAQRVWRFILNNFPLTCLLGEEIEGPIIL